MRITLLTLAMVTSLAMASPAASAATTPRAVPGTATVATGITEISSDPFTNSGSAHATEVEPDTYAVGATIVGTFQTGRFFNGGASDLGWATSLDAGRHWEHGVLPDTVYSHGRYARMSDPVVAYDRKDHSWLISGLTVNAQAVGTGVVVNRSTDALHWSKPVTVYAAPSGDFADKDWITCDNTPTSRHYGNCYAEFDLATAGDLVEMSVSTNGGRSWLAPKPTADKAHGLGGQPLVQPNGTVVVPFLGLAATPYIGAFVSTSGGASWSAAHHVVSTIDTAPDAGGLRNSALPSAQQDAHGTVYVVWDDCRFRTGCHSNDIVLSTSTNGTSWTRVVRVPIGSVTDKADRMLPAIGIAPGTSGSTARLAVYYYYYPTNSCAAQTCRLDVGYVSSVNGGKTWSAAVQVGGPTPLSRIAPTDGGVMVGDYIGTAVASGRAFALVAVGLPPVGGKKFNEPMVIASGGEPLTGGRLAAQSAATATPAAVRAPVATTAPRSF